MKLHILVFLILLTSACHSREFIQVTREVTREVEVTKDIEVTRVVEVTRIVTNDWRDIVYRHDFNSDDAMWRLGSTESNFGQANTRLENGIYRFRYSAERGVVVRRCLNDLPVSGNFIIEVGIQPHYVSPDTTYGVLFREEGDGANYYALGLNTRGQYRLFVRQNDQVRDLIDWTSDSVISRTNMNHIEIRVHGARFELLANGRYLDTAFDTSVMGDGLCFFMSLSANKVETVSYDNLLVYRFR